MGAQPTGFTTGNRVTDAASNILTKSVIWSSPFGTAEAAVLQHYLIFCGCITALLEEKAS
jgi:hypothetical protein